jgi:hypothetical protein
MYSLDGDFEEGVYLGYRLAFCNIRVKSVTEEMGEALRFLCDE